jgi:hypothetical protein
MDRPDEAEAAARDARSEHARSRRPGAGDSFSGFAKAGRCESRSGDPRAREPEAGSHAASDPRGASHACRNSGGDSKKSGLNDSGVSKTSWELVDLPRLTG